MEVGKKYKSCEGAPIAECLYYDDETYVMRYLGNRHVLSGKVGSLSELGWQEHHEPKIESTEYAAFWDKNGVFLAGRPGSTFHGAENIGAIRITSTDGKLTSVEIIKEP